jgi:squalene cyclase
MRRLALPPKTILERDVKKFVQDYLKAEGFHFLRTNAGMAWNKSFPMKLAEKGTADLVVFVPGDRLIVNPFTGKGETCPVERAVWVETKRGSSVKLSQDQLDFRRSVIERKGLYYRINSSDEMRTYFPPRMELQFAPPPETLIERHVAVA